MRVPTRQECELGLLSLLDHNLRLELIAMLSNELRRFVND